jgi:hypothetical protein
MALVVNLKHQEITRMLDNLDNGLPGLLNDEPDTELWIEFLQRAEDVRDQVVRDYHASDATRIDAILSKYDIPPTPRWVINGTAVS